MDRRDKLLAGLNLGSGVGVEIGALDRPFLRRSEGQVIYVDFTDSDSLRSRYKTDVNVVVDRIVTVDAIWGTKTYRKRLALSEKWTSLLPRT